MKYVANPVIVDAFVIKDIIREENAASRRVTTSLKLDNGRYEIIDDAMTSRYYPKPGDYFVIQEDGYLYINPKDVFERKYSPQKAAA